MHRLKIGMEPMTGAPTAPRLDAWPLRVIWPAHTAKRMALRFRRAIDTTTKWLSEGVPYEQRQAMADVIDAELDRIEREAQALRAHSAWLRGFERAA